MTITKTMPARPTGPIACAPWCQEGDGHPDEAFVADQYCSSEEQRVDLSLYRDPAPDEPSHLVVYAHRASVNAAPEVQVIVRTARDGSESGISFTPEEFARFLTAGRQVLDLL